MPEVVVVGAGPAGLVVARMLQRAGVPFVLLEQRPRAELDTYPKAGLIEFQTVELLTNVGIADVDLFFKLQNGRMEFRTPAGSAIFDYGALTGGRTNYVYPQHELVGALTDALVAEGADLRFGQAVASVRQHADRAVVTLADGAELAAQAVVGSDGARSVVAKAMRDVRVSEELMPAQLLAVIADAPPLVDHTIYGLHPRGFIGQMRRGGRQTRYYLEIPYDDRREDWTVERIRAELSSRLGVEGELANVSFGEPSEVGLRIRMRDTLQQGRIYLAGDAAHLITPAAGKGMNLAIQDAVALAHRLIARFGPRRNDSLLETYSTSRLPAIWRTQSFSLWYLRTLMTSLRGGLADGLADGWVASLRDDPRLARWFAHAYAGVDTDDLGG